MGYGQAAADTALVVCACRAPRQVQDDGRVGPRARTSALIGAAPSAVTTAMATFQAPAQLSPELCAATSAAVPPGAADYCIGPAEHSSRSSNRS